MSLDAFETHERHTDIDSGDRHAALYDRDPTFKSHVQHWRGTLNKQELCKEFRERYRNVFGLDRDDFAALEALGILRREGAVEITPPGDDAEPFTHYILEGHRWMSDVYDIDWTTLHKLGLVARPQIDGAPRERLLNRTVWGLTPAGRDLVGKQWAGPGIGDPGEEITHVFGVWLTVAYYRANLDMQKYQIERYEELDGNVYDIVIYREGRGSWSSDLDGTIAYTIEVETEYSDPQGAVSDAKKLGQAPGASVWVFPTRSVLTTVVNSLAKRGYVALDDDCVPGRGNQLPSTLGTEYCRKRIKRASQYADLPHLAMTDVLTFDKMKKQIEKETPRYFYPAYR